MPDQTDQKPTPVETKQTTESVTDTKKSDNGVTVEQQLRETKGQLRFEERRVNELAEENNSLKERIAALEAKVNPKADDKGKELNPALVAMEARLANLQSQLDSERKTRKQQETKAYVAKLLDGKLTREGQDLFLQLHESRMEAQEHNGQSYIVVDKKDDIETVIERFVEQYPMLQPKGGAKGIGLKPGERSLDAEAKSLAFGVDWKNLNDGDPQERARRRNEAKAAIDKLIMPQLIKRKGR